MPGGGGITGILITPTIHIMTTMPILVTIHTMGVIGVGVITGLIMEIRLLFTMDHVVQIVRMDREAMG